MEYFPLGDLQKFMRDRPPFPEDETRQIVQQLLEGAEFMHENGFAHRDLKPGVSRRLITNDIAFWSEIALEYTSRICFT
jgi:hypothetical protein